MRKFKFIIKAVHIPGEMVYLPHHSSYC